MQAALTSSARGVLQQLSGGCTDTSQAKRRSVPAAHHWQSIPQAGWPLTAPCLQACWTCSSLRSTTNSRKQACLTMSWTDQQLSSATPFQNAGTCPLIDTRWRHLGALALTGTQVCRYAAIQLAHSCSVNKQAVQGDRVTQATAAEHAHSSRSSKSSKQEHPGCHESCKRMHQVDTLHYRPCRSHFWYIILVPEHTFSSTVIQTRAECVRRPKVTCGMTATPCNIQRAATLQVAYRVGCTIQTAILPAHLVEHCNAMDEVSRGSSNCTLAGTLPLSSQSMPRSQVQVQGSECSGVAPQALISLVSMDYLHASASSSKPAPLSFQHHDRTRSRHSITHICGPRPTQPCSHPQSNPL